MANTHLAALFALLMAIVSVEGFGLSAPRPTAHTRRTFAAASSSSSSSSGIRRRNSATSTAMFFDFGKKKTSSVNARPVAGGTVKGGKKSKVVQEVSPALQRQRDAAQKKVLARKVVRKTEGVFTPPQFEAFKKARKEVPSGSGDAYWQKIAAKVPGQNAAACKRVAESMLFEAAVGSKSNYFGGYIEVNETPDYVDPEADIMFKINKLFGRAQKSADN